MRRALRFLSRLLMVLAILLVLLAGTGWWAMHASLAKLDGELHLEGLDAPVSIERDALGVVTVHAASERDAARALGYVHGQERFFEMDLLRRSAAGELSELFGPIAIDRDKAIRVHRLRARVLANVQAFAGDKLDVLTAYRDGVNAGLHDLKVRPWPYLLLRTQPKDWQLSDSAMAGYAMYFDLQDESNSRELALWRIKQVTPDALYKLIAADGTEWDAPLEGGPRGNVALPGPETLDLRKLATPAEGMEYQDSEPAAPGSNNFAVAGALTKDNRAIVASDMHLTLRAPNLWFRARLVYNDDKAPEGKVDVGGFSLPGLPAIIVGSNRHVAWGFTNSYGDWLDWATIDGHAKPQPWVVHREEIKIKGAPSVYLDVKDSPWGPILHEGKDGNMLALRWTAHRPGSLSVGVMKFAESGNLEQALANADTAGMPAQNLMLADATGRIAWALIGQPAHQNTACDWTAPITLDPVAIGGDQPLCPADGTDIGWKRPMIIDPPQNRLWTANNRVTDGDDLKRIGDSGYANGARAKQIRDDLFSKNHFAEQDLLAVQIDDRTLFLQRWWQQLRALSEHSENPALKEIAAATTHWDERAAPNAVSYRIVRAWRLAVIDRIMNGLTAPAQVALGKDFVMPDLPQIEGVAWQLVTEKPAHLLPRKFATWDALLSDAAQEIVGELDKKGPLPRRTWGERNTAHICHPLMRALPKFTERWLCMPAEPLAGDANMPRVVAPDFGASERMVVSPGHEEDGIIHMPGGQSGNPLSPFWGAGHEAWVHGEPTSFLPGKATHTLTMKP
jgi:penicillin amidase